MQSESNEKRVISGTVAAQAGGNKVEFNRPKAAPLVEDTSVVGGVDEQTGAPVIRPRTSEGCADESTRATDRREGHG